ncbi:Kinesin-like protein kifc1 [Mactra antiquata]
MSRIPVFIERSARKGWNTSVEHCIFIACKSVDTSTDVDSRLSSESSVDCVKLKEIPDLTDVTIDTDTTHSNGINTDINDDGENVTVDKLIDKVQLNDTLESKFEDVDVDTQIIKVDKHSKGLSEAVISCNKDIDNETSDCAKCSFDENVTQFDTSCRKTIGGHSKSSVLMNGDHRNEIIDVNLVNDSKASRSLIPRPVALKAGLVMMTAAPVKKPRSKYNKRQKENKDQYKLVYDNKNDALKYQGNGLKMNKSKVNSNTKESSKNVNEIGPVCKNEEIKDSVFLSLKGKVHPTVVKQSEISYDSEAVNSDKVKLYNGSISDDVVLQSGDKCCTESGLCKSHHEYEDSEPECVQHNDNDSDINRHGKSLHSGINNLKDFMSILKPKPSKLGANQSVSSFIHRNGTSVMLTSNTTDKGMVKLVKCVKPKRSCIPKFRHQTVSHNDNETSEKPGKVDSHDSASLTVAVNASYTKLKNHCGSLNDGSLPVKDSSDQCSTSSVLEFKVNSDCCDKSKTSCENVYLLENTVLKTSDRDNTSQQNQPVKQSQVKKPSPIHMNDNISNGCPKNEVTQTNTRSSELCTNSYIAVPTVNKHVNEIKKCSIPHRNLPQAPASVRTVHIGHRLDISHSRSKIKHDTKPGAGRPGTRNSNGKPPTNNQTSASNPVSSNKVASKSKRPAWDLKGRLQDMEEQWKQKQDERNEFMIQMQQCNERIASLESHNNQLSGTVAQKEENYSHASKEIENLQKMLRESENELYEVKRQFERETENFEFTKGTLKRQKEALEGEITGLQQEVSGLKSSIAQLTSSQAGLKSELEATKLALDQATDTIATRDSTIRDLEQSVEEKTNLINELNSKCRDHETTRRKLHNTIQELKGNIRVFCRVRPLIGDELYGNDGEIQHMNFPDEDQKVLELEKLADVSLSESTIGSNRNGKGKYEFSFDKVFSPTSTQACVFEEISQLVQSALDGYNVCIFAYGQTGSGKTYTMEGPSVIDEESRGMISRAVLQIFNSTEELEDKGWQYGFEASFLEIYNETIRDLLGNHGNDVKHDIKMTGTTGGDVMVTNLTTVPVSAEHQITDLLKTASRNRAVGETQCNERSSRSHSVFRLKITGANEITGEQCKGTLNLVDLAGSERLKESGATGQRLKETQSINKSLSNLGNVIMALGNKEGHVPYRNSKLTYLLQNSLGGNSKTLMFVNVSPREENFSETLNSLRFATKVNQCNIGTATKKSR